MKAAFVSLAISSGLVTGLALAQAPAPAPTQRNPAAPAAAPPGTPTPAPGSPGVATPPAAGAPTGEPSLPTIDDPMLRPPPPAAHVLTSWRQAIDLVRRRSTTLRTSLARVDQAAAIARQALSDALPQLSARGTIDRELLRSDRSTLTLVGGVPTTTVEAVPDPATFLRAALDLRVPLFAPAAWSNRGSALDAVDATRLSVKETERLIIAGVADAIVSAVTAERLADVSRVSLASALSTLDLNKRRAALGASSMLDVLRVEQEVQLARAQVVSADENLLRSREALGATLGS